MGVFWGDLDLQFGGIIPKGKQKENLVTLSDTKVRNAKSGPEAYKMADGHGLFLLVQTTGGKLWRWKYRFDGKEKLMSFGPYPDITLAQARELHAAARHLLASGTDPMAQRKSEQTAERVQEETSFANITKLWMEHWKDGRDARYAIYVRRRLDLDILPRLGTRPIAEIEGVAICQQAVGSSPGQTVPTSGGASPPRVR